MDNFLNDKSNVEHDFLWFSKNYEYGTPNSAPNCVFTQLVFSLLKGFEFI